MSFGANNIMNHRYSDYLSTPVVKKKNWPLMQEKGLLRVTFVATSVDSAMTYGRT
jgi:hypothetical protein